MKGLKTKIFAALLIIPALGFSAPYEVNVPVEHIYSPAGFDSNDNAEVIVTGYLPNLCYKVPSSKSTIVNGKIVVDVKANYNKVGLGFCVNVMVPYMEVVKVGVLDQGQYKITVNENSNLEKKSSIGVVEASSNSIDDSIYARVDHVISEDDGSRRVKLKGYNPSDCFELKEIIIEDNGTDTYSILPKMKQVRSFCPKKMIPFTYEFTVPTKLESDQVLLHVRVMDGRSINAIFNNKLSE